MLILVLRWMTAPDLSLLPFLLLGMPFHMVGGVTLCILYIIPFDYSPFGKFWRTALPTEPPLRILANMFRVQGFAGRANMGVVIWLLYGHGIGVKTMFGNVFIPLDEIDGLDLDRGFDKIFCRDTATLYHHCPEIREPVYIPLWAARVAAAYYPSKVIVQGTAI